MGRQHQALAARSGYRYHFRQDGRRSASETASFASRMEMEKGLCLHQPIPSRVASRFEEVANAGNVEGVVRQRMLNKNEGVKKEMIRKCAAISSH